MNVLNEPNEPNVVGKGPRGLKIKKSFFGGCFGRFLLHLVHRYILGLIIMIIFLYISLINELNVGVCTYGRFQAQNKRGGLTALLDVVLQRAKLHRGTFGSLTPFPAFPQMGGSAHLGEGGGAGVFCGGGRGKRLNELALFTGAGGGLLGTKLLGWRTVCYVEWNCYAIEGGAG